METFQMWVVRGFFGIVVLGALGIALWCWGTLAYSYSKGERTGYVQKISQRGWLFKTWEGELAMVTIPGSMQQTFQFSARRADIVRQIEATMGKRVVIQYEEHLGTPKIFGDTNYFVTQVRAVEDVRSATTGSPVTSTDPFTRPDVH